MNEAVRIDRSAASRARFSVGEFAEIFSAAALQDIRLELVNGELERMTPPMGGHSSRQSSLLARLWAEIGARSMVEATIDLGDETVMTCDVAVLREPMKEQRFLCPDEVVLAVEIAETTIVRDTTLKRIAYAAAGITDYWVVDGARGVVHVFRDPVDGEYSDMSTVRFGQPIAVPGMDAMVVVD